MKIKFYPPILLFLLACLVLVFSNSCGKDDPASPRSGNCTNGKTTAVFSPAVIYGTMTDQDGNVYKTVKIGTQTWMAENLRTTKYRDGSDIPLVYLNVEWAALSTGAYCNYSTTSNCDTIATFGRLYNYYAVTDSRQIAPAGWHVSTYEEWETLESFLGSNGNGGKQGGLLKESGTSHWHSPNTGAVNETGFTAIPSGARSTGGTYEGIGEGGVCWTTGNTAEAGHPWGYAYLFNKASINRAGTYENTGYAIRCVKD